MTVTSLDLERLPVLSTPQRVNLARRTAVKLQVLGPHNEVREAHMEEVTHM